MTAIRVTIAAARGSTPRDAGTAMLVFADRIEGTIGGGALEWRAMRVARDMLDQGQIQREETVPLGPGLGQCCGGAVTLSFQLTDAGVPKEGGGAALDLGCWACWARLKCDACAT